MDNFNFFDPTTKKDIPNDHLPLLPDLKKMGQEDKVGNSEELKYIVDEDLKAVINMAILLGQPLLLTGNPGTGKTKFADFVAQQCNLGKVLRFDAQTSSIKKDLFYNYNALGHFRAASDKNDQIPSNKSAEDLYITCVGLGRAIKDGSHSGGKRHVVLIDEIDKAPRDFTNDLLGAIESLSFEIPEVTEGGNLIKYACLPQFRPIVIITSNSEKNLPDAFLRRVIYHHIEDPNREQLIEILKSKTKLFEKANHAALVDYFLPFRNNSKLLKKPATAELLSWAAYLCHHPDFDVEKLEDIKELSTKEKSILMSSHSIFLKTKDDLADSKK